jgi:hypothetical protein
VIARIWRGWTQAEDEASYVEYLEATGAPASRVAHYEVEAAE